MGDDRIGDVAIQLNPHGASVIGEGQVIRPSNHVVANRSANNFTVVVSICHHIDRGTVTDPHHLVFTVSKMTIVVNHIPFDERPVRIAFGAAAIAVHFGVIDLDPIPEGIVNQVPSGRASLTIFHNDPGSQTGADATAIEPGSSEMRDLHIFNLTLAQLFAMVRPAAVKKMPWDMDSRHTPFFTVTKSPLETRRQPP